VTPLGQELKAVEGGPPPQSTAWSRADLTAYSSSGLSTDHGLRRHLSTRVVNGTHNEDAVGFTTARRFAPNRPYRVTFNGGVHGPGDNAWAPSR
jgi:hypothetical protein